MNQMFTRLQNFGLRRVVTVFLTAIVFLIAPIFSHPQLFSARADLPVIQSDKEPLNKGTIKRIQQQAEDLGDSPDRPIGDTGLENIRELGENIPETIELKVRQTGEMLKGDDVTAKDLERVRDKVTRD